MEMEPSTPPENPQDENPEIDRKRLKKAIISAVAFVIFVGGIFMVLGQQFGRKDAESGYKSIADARAQIVDFSVPRLLPGNGFTQFVADGPRSYRKVEITLRDFPGKPVLVNLWASWCRPCRTELSVLDKEIGELSDSGLVVLPIMTADRSGVDGAHFFFRGADIKNLPVIVDHGQELMDALAVRVLPSTLFISPEGKVIGYSVSLNYEDPKTRELLIAFGRTGKLP